MENKVRVDGFLQDFALRVLKSGGAVGCGSISFGGGKSKDGKPLKRSYVKFEIWNPKAELSDALTAGASEERKPVVRLTGRLREDQWPDKTTGKTVRLLKVVAEDIVINPEGAFKPKTGGPAVKPSTPKAAPKSVTSSGPNTPPKNVIKTMPLRIAVPPPPVEDPVDVPPPAEEDMPF